MRVLMVADFYWPHLGGVEQHVRTLGHALARRGHQVTVATLRTGDTPAVEADGPVTVRRITSGTQRLPFLFDQSRPWAPPVSDPVAARQLAGLLDELRPDVVHGHDWLARSALGAARRRHIPVVTSLHYYTQSCAKKDLVRRGAPCPGPGARCVPCAADHYGALKGPLVAALNAVGVRHERRVSARTIAVSAATATGNGLEPGRGGCVVVPNLLPDPLPDPLPDLLPDGCAGVGLDAHADLLARLPTGPYLLFVGDLRAQKGADVLFRAYEQLDPAGRERVPLVAIGKVWPDGVTARPDGLRLELSWPNAAVLEAMRRASAVVVPSTWAEPFGIVAIEAMSVGTPVIASRTGGLGEVVEHDRSGLLVEPGDADALRTAMRRVLDDTELRRRLATGAQARAQDYAADVVVDQVLAVYAAAVAGAR